MGEEFEFILPILIAELRFVSDAGVVARVVMRVTWILASRTSMSLGSCMTVAR